MEELDVAIESAMSLHVRGMREPYGGGELRGLTQGTAFVVEHLGAWFLVTNIHVLTGRSPATGETMGSAALPSTLVVWHNTDEGLGHWGGVSYPLYDSDGRARWLEHPESPKWDIAALQIGPQPNFVYYPYKLNRATDRPTVSPGSDLSIVGFPFGTSSDGRFAIWSRATVASDPSLNYSGRPTFLVDSRSRTGQSGSPVILKTTGPVRYTSGRVQVALKPRAELFGIYSGRISAKSDLGIVWKSEAIREVIEPGRWSSRTFDD